MASQAGEHIVKTVVGIAAAPIVLPFVVWWHFYSN